MSNIPFFTALFGDSSAIVRYLSLVGYRLAPVEQTGSNFGMEVKHEMPGLAVVGTGTMVSDGLSIMNAEFSSSSFRVCPVTIGTRNFVGNGIAYPAGGRTGDNCLLATKVMIPVDGPVREGVGLLGSPCFEIPRTVRSDHQFDHLGTLRRRRHRLKAKNRHNAATIGEHLLVRWLYVSGLVLVALLPFGGGAMPFGGGITSDALATAAAALLDLAWTIGYFVLVEHVVTGFRRLRPRFCSIYQPAFWEHERFWKVPSVAYIQMFNGTPFKSVVWRLLGVRVGRRVLDDGCSIVERTLVRIGSECTLNAGSILQSHSLEDGTFKSDHIVIGDRCTIGTGAFVHYGITMSDDAVLDADSFLMKGEHVPAGSRWYGNPAADARATRAAPAAAARAPVAADAASSPPAAASEAPAVADPPAAASEAPAVADPPAAASEAPAVADPPAAASEAPAVADPPAAAPQAPAPSGAKAKTRVPVEAAWAAVFAEDPAPPAAPRRRRPRPEPPPRQLPPYEPPPYAPRHSASPAAPRSPAQSRG